MTMPLRNHKLKRKLRRTADLNVAMPKMVASFHMFDLLAFVPPLTPGWPVQPRDFDVHVASSAAVTSLVIDLDMVQSCQVSNLRPKLCKLELRALVQRVAARKDAVQRAPISDTNLHVKRIHSSASLAGDYLTVCEGNPLGALVMGRATNAPTTVFVCRRWWVGTTL